jgi:hypothetical protein
MSQLEQGVALGHRQLHVHPCLLKDMVKCRSYGRTSRRNIEEEFLDSPWPRNHRSSSFPEARLPSNPKSAAQSGRASRDHTPETRIAAWANQVVDMGLLTQTAEPPDGRQLESRQTRQAVLALVNTGRFSPGRVSMESDRAPRCWFSQVPHFRLGGPKSSGLMAEPVPDAAISQGSALSSF